MNTNHNILIGGGLPDIWINDNKRVVGDKIYFKKTKPPNKILFKLKLINFEEKEARWTLGVDDSYEEGVKAINDRMKELKIEKIEDEYPDLKHLMIALKFPEKMWSAPLRFYHLKTGINSYKSLGKDMDKALYSLNNPKEEKKAPVAKKQTKKQTKKVVKKTKQNKTKKAPKTTKCKYKEATRRCNKANDDDEHDDRCVIENDRCKKIEEKKPQKTPKVKKGEPKPKVEKDKNCNELIKDMKKFVMENGSLDHVDKSKKEYNDFLQCVEKKNRDDEKKEGEDLEEDDYLLYPLLEDPNFNKKIYNKKEFRDGNKYAERELPDDKKSRGKEFEKTVDSICKNIEFELLPHQKFIRNYLSFATPYNSLLIYHGLGTGKTCSSIGVAEEFRTYANQMGVNKKIIIVASKLVQDNYKKQLFPEHKLKKVGGLWNIKSCVGNKFIKEINPMNMENLSREDVVRQINVIIRENYEFMAYLEFARQIEKEIKKFSIKEGDDDKQIKIKIQAIRDKYSDRLIIIDEVHNIRDTEIVGNKKDMNTMKSTTEYFQKLVTYADNLKLLLLTGTPMYNSHEEIIWLLNLMNLNDDRYSIKTTDIFNSDGSMTENGEELLIQKSRGYVSFVQGEDPYLFPFRLYPNDDTTLGGYRNNSLKHMMKETDFSYPTKQMNDHDVPQDRNEQGIKYLDLFMTKPGDEQKEGYEGYIQDLIDNNLLNAAQENFSYTMLTVPSQLLNICYPKTDKEDWKYRYGSNGLKQIMNYNHSLLNEFEYKENYEGFFKQDNLRQYSGKIAEIIKEVDRSKGIVLIYSQFIEGGCIPVALALEESGYSKHGGSLFKNKKGVVEKGKYIMITGNKELNKNLKKTMNICNDKKNKDGSEIKVIIISQAGSEGLDFANIRQVHILDAWYNLNRTGQIEGRAIRNQSHCNLDFKDRNVLICLHGTYGLTDNKEAADLYMYRVAEKKAEITGKVARVLKETAIDCKLNENQQNLNKKILNVKRKIYLPREEKVGDKRESIQIEFEIGHSEKSQICDFMDCEFNCKPNIGEDGEPNIYTYNEKFITLTVTKIIEIIKRLFKEKYMFEKEDLINSIKVKREYKRDEILNALSILINDKTEYIEDNLGRKGRLLNVKDLYLFQPIEIGQEQLTIYQRQHPMPYKPNSFMIKLEDFKKKGKDKIDIIDEFFEHLEFVLDDNKFENTMKSWLKDKSEEEVITKKFHYNVQNVITLLSEKMKMNRDELKKYSVFKMIDGLKDNFKSKLKLLNIYHKDEMYKENIRDDAKKIIKEYFSKYMFMENEYCIISNFKSDVFDDKSKGQIFVVKKVGDKYDKIVESSMMLYLKKYIEEKPIEKMNTNKIYELIGFSSYIDGTRKDDIVFRYKKIEGDKVNKGVRCDNNSNKMESDDVRATLIKVLFEKNPDDFNDGKIAELNKQKKFDVEDRFDKYAHITPYHTCLMIEYILRYLNDKKIYGKRYFFDCVDTILYGVSELPKKKTIYQDLLIE